MVFAAICTKRLRPSELQRKLIPLLFCGTPGKLPETFFFVVLWLSRESPRSYLFCYLWLYFIFLLDFGLHVCSTRSPSWNQVDGLPLVAIPAQVARTSRAAGKNV